MENLIERRRVIHGAGLLAGAAVAATLAQQTAFAQTEGPKPVPYDIKPLPFDPKSVKGLSEKLLLSHFENNYSGAVKRLNAITAQLAELDVAKAPVFSQRPEARATHRHALDDPARGLLRRPGRRRPTPAAAIARDFGSVDRWRFRILGHRQGRGRLG